jgi:hypothetical protein
MDEIQVVQNGQSFQTISFTSFFLKTMKSFVDQKGPLKKSPCTAGYYHRFCGTWSLTACCVAWEIGASRLKVLQMM